MKIVTKSFFSTAAAGMVAASMSLCFVEGSFAKGEPKFSDLEKKLNIDRSPLKGNTGLVTSYADVIEKARPAVVSIFRTKPRTRGI